MKKIEKEVTVVLIFNEKYSLFEVHRYNRSFRLWGPTVRTEIAFDSTKESVIISAKKKLFGEYKILEQMVFKQEDWVNSKKTA